MDPLTWMLVLGGIAFFMAKDAQADAAKDGRDISLPKAFGERAGKVAKPVAAKVGEKLHDAAKANKQERAARRAAAREERQFRREAAAQGFAPFGEPTTKRPAWSAKNPSGVEQFLLTQPSILQRLMAMFGHEPKKPRVYRKGFDTTPEQPTGEDKPKNDHTPGDAPPAEAGTPGAEDAPTRPQPAASAGEDSPAAETPKVRITPGGGEDIRQPPRNARGLTPEQEYTVRERIARRLAKEQPEAEDVTPAAWVMRVKREEYGRAAEEFTAAPSRTSARIIQGVVVQRSAPQAEPVPEHIDTADNGEREAAMPAYTSVAQFEHAKELARLALTGEIDPLQQRRDVEQDPDKRRALGEQIRAKRNEFETTWRNHEAALMTYLRSAEAQGRCAHCGHDLSTPYAQCPHRCTHCGCGSAAEQFARQMDAESSGHRAREHRPQAGPASPDSPPPAAPTAPPASSEPSASAPSFTATPLHYLEALHQFAASAMTTASIPALIGSLRSCGEAFRLQGSTLHQVAKRLSEEALLDERVVELVRAAADSAIRSGDQYTSSADIAAAYYRQWIEAVSNGARVPSQSVLAATSAA